MGVGLGVGLGVGVGVGVGMGVGGGTETGTGVRAGVVVGVGLPSHAMNTKTPTNDAASRMILKCFHTDTYVGILS